MQIKCFRCQKLIDSPNPNNADYIIATDTVVTESTPVIVAICHNTATLTTQARINEIEEYQDAGKVQITSSGDSAWEAGDVVPVRQYDAERKKLDALSLKSPTGETPYTITRHKFPDLVINDQDYTRTIIASLADSYATPNLVRVEPGVRQVAVQKTAIICPDCYKVGDTVIWGVHRRYDD